MIHLIGTAAALVGVCTFVPQLWRLVRRPETAGLSLLSNLLGVLTAGTWLGYGVWLADGPQLLANIPCLLGGTAIVALIAVRNRCLPWWLVAGPAAWALVATACSLGGGVSGLGLAATGIGLLSRIPQVRAAVTSTDLAGVSLPTQWLSLVSAGLWFGYGTGSHLLPVSLSSGTAILLLLGIIVPTLRARAAGHVAVPDDLRALAAEPVGVS